MHRNVKKNKMHRTPNAVHFFFCKCLKVCFFTNKRVLCLCFWFSLWKFISSKARESFLKFHPNSFSIQIIKLYSSLQIIKLCSSLRSKNRWRWLKDTQLVLTLGLFFLADYSRPLLSSHFLLASSTPHQVLLPSFHSRHDVVYAMSD